MRIFLFEMEIQKADVESYQLIIIVLRSVIAMESIHMKARQYFDSLDLSFVFLMLFYSDIICFALFIYLNFVIYSLFFLQNDGILITTYDIVRFNAKLLTGSGYYDDDDDDGPLWDYMILDEVGNK